MKFLKEQLKIVEDKLGMWEEHYRTRLLFYCMILIFLFLLKSAGYFNPFFEISVNFIIMTGLILSVFFLKASGKSFFLVALLFWIFAAILRYINIDPWAERTAFYAYQALVIGVLISLYQNIKD